MERETRWTKTANLSEKADVLSTTQWGVVRPIAL